MFPVISIGSVILPTAGLVYIIGAWMSLSLVERSARQLRLDSDAVYGVSAWALFAGLVGARLTYVAIFWAAFRENLLGIVWPLNTGYNLWGGVIVGAVAAVVYGRSQRLRLSPTLDALVPGFVLLLIFVSLADFLAGPGFGKLTRVPWGITQFSVRRHAVQIYEIIVGMIALFTWWRAARGRLFEGQLFLLCLTVYSGGRLFVDAYRQDAMLTSGGYHVVQIASLIAMIGGLYLLGYLAEHTPRRKQR